MTENRLFEKLNFCSLQYVGPASLKLVFGLPSFTDGEQNFIRIASCLFITIQLNGLHKVQIASESLYGGQFTLSTQSIKTNYDQLSYRGG